ncbi:MAG: hypothetical protein HYR93_04000 [Chloroflexi bacterium]|nr:hypothetical protein [Chloroflexota bacterium]
MKRFDFRIWVGAGLILLGILMLLERFGLFRGAADLFWGLVFVAGGAYFLYRFAANMRGEWWAAIPGFALLGIGADGLLSHVVGDWSGFFFLGLLGAGFFAVYLSDRGRWWALIPGGVLVTLGFVSVLTDVYGARETGGFFFLGLGITFLLVAILASLQWAYIPGVILLAMGAVLGSSYAGALNYIWPAALILAGLALILQFLRPKK